MNSVFSVGVKSEITMEMNPATVTAENLAAYPGLGVNRASFGVQTFNDRALKLLARGHDANDARATFTMLRDAGFDNVSFDLIAGLPGQTLDGVETKPRRGDRTFARAYLALLARDSRGHAARGTGSHRPSTSSLMRNSPPRCTR